MDGVDFRHLQNLICHGKERWLQGREGRNQEKGKERFDRLSRWVGETIRRMAVEGFAPKR